ncbi:SDR family oxidoreductase [Commensalibacter nepenthis]|uniref:NAD(P)H-binding protein n=1 Tax=Commensalibacter nepenthis TaxID=3043872 RepID=A0ABT6Q8L0_9PROT|nr:NAD(P)H-binding protein [Commensalibacter sp. TBRC 10068]MDI2113243.1 NAD(P)H-binding protein [Commensalibacter sp. TBRC 10068]
MKQPFSLPQKIHVIGASGRSGSALIKELQNQGCTVIALVRNPEKWHKINLSCDYRIIDLKDSPAMLADALQDATHIVNTAHARHAPAILKAGPKDATYVFLGSTRKFTQWPDSHGNGVLAGEQAFIKSGRKGVFLHPTMIYGSQGENNVQRLARLLRKLPIIPLPNGGKALVQPIHQSDVTKAVLSALSRQWDAPNSIVIAGGSVLSYKEFIQIILQQLGIQPKIFIPLPVSLLKTAAFFTKFVPFIPTIERDEIQRLVENKNFDITEMKEKLDFEPIEFTIGIKQTKL